MIPQRLKICSDCKQKKQIFSHGRCAYCSKIHSMRSKPPQPSVYRRSGFRGPKVYPERRGGLKRTYIKPRSDKRIEQEKEYAKFNPGNKQCFFCWVAFKKDEERDKHHLKGRRGKNLTDRKYIVHVHRGCHDDYHNKSVKDIPWHAEFALRLRRIDMALYEKEMNKYDK